MNRNRLIALAATLSVLTLAGCVDDRYGPPRWDDTRYPPRHGGDYTRYPPRHGDDYTWYPPRHGGDQPRYHPRPPVPPMPPRPRRAPRPPFSEPIFCTQEYGRPRHSDCDDRRRPHRGGDQYYTTNQ
ncbi:hypothetical protein [Aminobacter ciceronei]|uniref:hypothetical protein n=1 Tax=Aminobacter ciceronei TaxID=150723 RepID=UPI003F707D1A